MGVTLISKDFRKMVKIPQIYFKVKSVVHDKKFSCLVIVDEALSYVTYNLRSHQLSTRKRGPQDLSRVLNLDIFGAQLVQQHQAYFTQQKDSNFLSYEHADENILHLRRLMKGRGIEEHNPLQYMMMGLKCPVEYSPKSSIHSGYSAQLAEVLKHKQAVL
jgi:hypothetical protein